MKQAHNGLLPKARKSDLITRQIPNELLIYDLERHQAFCLNDTAARIWRRCNGKRTVAELAAQLEKELQSPVAEGIVHLALNQLATFHLLQKPASESSFPVSRRALMRRGLAIAIALPIVTMIAAPTVSDAASLVTATACAARNPALCNGTQCTDNGGKPNNKNCVFSPNSGLCKCK